MHYIEYMDGGEKETPTGESPKEPTMATTSKKLAVEEVVNCISLPHFQVRTASATYIFRTKEEAENFIRSAR